LIICVSLFGEKAPITANPSAIIDKQSSNPISDLRQN
jgi:hypothetical protein